MSVQLFTTDYMSVVGEYTKKVVGGDCVEGGEPNELVEEYIHLFFTIQINGKIRTSQHYIKLYRDENLEETDEHSNLTLASWEGWYILRNTLSDLGYPLGNSSNLESDGDSRSIINWIDKAYKAYKNKDCFNR